MPARATSDIEIAQRAQVLAGMRAMDSWEDPDPQTLMIRAYYEDLVTSELAGHDWKFCTGDQVLQRLEDVPLFGFSAAYQLPAAPACLHVKAIRINGSLVAWRLSHDKVHVDAADTDEVQLSGQFRQPVGLWPPFFTLYMEARLAAWISASVTRNGSLAELWAGEANALLVKARSRDAMQQTLSRLPIGRYHAVRRGGRSQ